MRSLLLTLGLPDFPLLSLIIFLAIVFVAMLMFGWISDLLLGDGGFGVAINGGLILFGAIAGTLLSRRLGLVVGPGTTATAALIATGSGMFTLVFCGVMRRWV
jgi:hypothetical protein